VALFTALGSEAKGVRFGSGDAADSTAGAMASG
jgi:hypothetical protein